VLIPLRSLRSLRSISTAKRKLLPKPYSHNYWIKNGGIPDRGGVQAPQSYELEYWDGNAWQPIKDVKKKPEQPVGGELNQASFTRVRASKMRVWFQHAGKARSGVTEIFVWNY
jgi:hypothetical protein